MVGEVDKFFFDNMCYDTKFTSWIHILTQWTDEIADSGTVFTQIVSSDCMLLNRGSFSLYHIIKCTLFISNLFI